MVEPGLGTEEPLEQPPLSPEAIEKTLYLRHNETCHSSSATCYEPLVTAANDLAHTNFGTRLQFESATADLSHVVFQSDVALTASPSAPGLYEWESGRPLQLVSVLPGGAPAPGKPELGTFSAHTPTPNVRHAISEDGSRIFWSEEESENEAGELSPEHLYMRDVPKGETLQIDAAQGVPQPGAEHNEVRFQTASSDGSKVFFTDTARLNQESTLPHLTGNPADLYECEVIEVAERLACDLKDLTVDPGENAGVLDVVLGAGGDGSKVYFVANGVLAPGASSGHCGEAEHPSEPPPGSTCNLYVYEPDPEHPGHFKTTFIAALSAEDQPDWGGKDSEVPESNLIEVTSRVSPNGRYLAFMSDRSLTGYDNIDANSGKADEEVYLYDSTSGRLFCASCNPSGAPPVGVLDRENAGEGHGLLVDRPEIWKRPMVGGEHPRVDTAGNRRRRTRHLPVSLSVRRRPAVLQQRGRAGTAGHERERGRL